MSACPTIIPGLDSNEVHSIDTAARILCYAVVKSGGKELKIQFQELNGKGINLGDWIVTAKRHKRGIWQRIRELFKMPAKKSRHQLVPMTANTASTKPRTPKTGKHKGQRR